MEVQQSFHSGYVAIVGPPNVGKSTLLNTLLDQKLAIVTSKPQTTRKRVLGILSGENYQIIFIDTPGIIKPSYDLQQRLMDYLQESITDADVICLMLDAQSDEIGWAADLISLIPDVAEVIPVINKVDLVDSKKVQRSVARIKKIYPVREPVIISAFQKTGVEKLLSVIISHLPEHPPYFPTDQLSDATERFFVAEIIREKIYELYSQEIPYSCHVEIENFVERSGRKDLIQAVIYVDQPSQKGILIGKGGSALKQTGQLARQDIETFLGRTVYLELYVKVLKDWRKKTSHLRNLGY